MKRYLISLVLAFTAISVPVLQTACTHVTTLEAGGVYSDPILAQTDRAILDASHALTGFIDWTQANAAYLAKYPDVITLADKILNAKDGWIRDAYAARDAYASALTAYRAGKGDQTTVSAKQAALNGAIAVLNNITAQITAAQTAHAHAN